MAEVLRSATIHPQSFALSRQEFFDQPRTQMTSDGQRYTRAPLGARNSATCSMVQSCQVNWQITIPKERLALQVNLAIVAALDPEHKQSARVRVKFDGLDEPQAPWTRSMKAGAEDNEMPYQADEHIKLWLGYSTACGPFQQFAICKDNTKLWETSIYAREQATIASNSLSDLCTKNSVSVSPLESAVDRKRHCGIFLDIPISEFGKTDGAFNFIIPYPITFQGVLDLNQLNPIFNSFSVFTHNYASLYLQLWTQDYLQDLKVVWLNKSNVMTNEYLAYHMIPPEKPDLIYLLNTATSQYTRFSVRIVNMEGKTHTEKFPSNSISQI
ncbi:MAG: hypothetical protein EZS28_014169 [Streblomastix strix]|uniref:Uncharacterized protein n=1 Tax=Streblomastix strix TaxID=222440 RepID=A0A5J4W5V6_9EUKA|nr:MAG: hypothetical protein EZS28_014169 [Streblomastix strix]